MKIRARTDERSAARRSAEEAAADEAEGMARFLRGLTIGALVGAAIAGSAIWQRARNQAGQRIGYETDATDRTDHVGDDLPGSDDPS